MLFSSTWHCRKTALRLEKKKRSGGGKEVNEGEMQ